MSTNDALPSIVTMLAGSTVLGAIVGAVLKGLWDRRAAKKIAKTEMRAEAYEDFVVHFVARAGDVRSQAPDAQAVENPTLQQIKARLLVFGESNVVNAVAKFLAHHESLDTSDGRKAFREVIRQMRKSVLTGHRSRVMNSVDALISTKSPPDSGARQASSSGSS